MVREALRGYLALASGLSDVTAARARAAARALVEQGEATAGQVSSLAEDLVATSRRNREALAVLVRHEVDQAVRRLGFAPAADSDELTRRMRRLERAVRDLQADLHRATTTNPARAERPARPAQPSAKKAVAKKAAAKKASAKRTPRKAATKTSARTTTKRTGTNKVSAKRTSSRATTRTRARKNAT